jgi:hypothetical protein
MQARKMKYGEFKKKVIEHLEQYKQKYMQGIGKGTFAGAVTDHDYILPKDMIERNLLPLSIGIKKVHYHMYACHLNSSQMMCINFFAPILKEDQLLIEILKKQLNITISPQTRIIKSEFEYTPDGQKHTNLDLYLELSNYMKIYIETKYTENGFGGIKEDIKYPDRYEREWNSFYKDQLSKSMHFKEMSQSEFYKDYQINRNIAYVKNDKDYVCFIYPFDNVSLHEDKRLESIDLENVYKIDWNDLCQTALDMTVGTIYNDHYVAFREKYLEY